MSEHPPATIHEDLNWERKWYRFERIAWLLMFVLMLAGASGALGRGGLTRAEARSSDGTVRVEYDRSLRARAPARMRVMLDPGATATGEIRLVVAGALADSARIRESFPPPAIAEPLDRAVRLVWKVPARSAAEIVLANQPEGMGRIWSRVTVEGGAFASFDQLVLP
jgi:hypothetical protein